MRRASALSGGTSPPLGDTDTLGNNNFLNSQSVSWPGSCRHRPDKSRGPPFWPVSPALSPQSLRMAESVHGPNSPLTSAAPPPPASSSLLPSLTSFSLLFASFLSFSCLSISSSHSSTFFSMFLLSTQPWAPFFSISRLPCLLSHSSLLLTTHLCNSFLPIIQQTRGCRLMAYCLNICREV